MTIIYEQREINDQVLLVQLQFTSHNLQISGNQVSGCSLDKYISLDCWSQIYTKLEAQLEQYKANTAIQPKEDTIRMERAQLELRISWRNLKSYHKDIASIETKNCDLCPYVLTVKIYTISLLSKYRKLHDKKTEKTTTKTTIDDVLNERTQNGTSTSTASASQSTNFEEYIPAPVAQVGSSLDYTPSTVPNSSESITPSKCGPPDEYTPSLHNADDGDNNDVTYTPTKIARQKAKNRLHDVNRNDCSDKRKRTGSKLNDLFGGDSGDDTETNGNGTVSTTALRSLRSAKKPTSNEIIPGTPNIQPKIDTWVTTGRSKKATTNQQPIKQNENCPEKKPKIAQPSPSEPCSPKSARKKELELWAKFREGMPKDTGRTSSNDRNIDLTDLSPDQIIKTFGQHQKTLERLVRKYKNIPDHAVKPTINECNYLLICDNLTKPQKFEMFRKIQDEFFKSETLSRGSLIWKLLLPEWGLNIFMERFSMTRDEAMEQLGRQDDAKTIIDSDFKNMGEFSLENE